jgi:hypothetical protein
MVADGRLRETNRLSEVTDAGLGSWLRRNEAEKAKPRRIGECFEHRGELLGVSLVERRMEDGRATGNDPRLRHSVILTCFDGRSNIERGRYPARRSPMANTSHVAVYVQRIPEAVEKYRKILGLGPAKARP